jgi:hypothetical protein
MSKQLCTHSNPCPRIITARNSARAWVRPSRRHTEWRGSLRLRLFHLVNGRGRGRGRAPCAGEVNMPTRPKRSIHMFRRHLFPPQLQFIQHLGFSINIKHDHLYVASHILSHPRALPSSNTTPHPSDNNRAHTPTKRTAPHPQTHSAPQDNQTA